MLVWSTAQNRETVGTGLIRNKKKISQLQEIDEGRLGKTQEGAQKGWSRCKITDRQYYKQLMFLGFDSQNRAHNVFFVSFFFLWFVNVLSCQILVSSFSSLDHSFIYFHLHLWFNSVSHASLLSLLKNKIKLKNGLSYLVLFVLFYWEEWVLHIFFSQMAIVNTKQFRECVISAPFTSIHSTYGLLLRWHLCLISVFI